MVIISLMRYYENVKVYNIIWITVVKSFSIFVKAFVGSLPIFIAFGLLGMCLFNQNSFFAFFSFTSFTLLSMAMGDLLPFMFLELKEITFLIAQIYLYLYMFISIAIIFNIIVVIVGDGYIAAKTYSKYEWIKQKDEFQEEGDKKNINTFFSSRIQGEDPLDPFRDKSPAEERRKNRIRMILLKDKQMHRERFAQSLGIPLDRLGKRPGADETPVQRLVKEKDYLSQEGKEGLKLLKVVQGNVLKKIDDEPSDEKDDYRDRLRSTLKKFRGSIKVLKDRIEQEKEILDGNQNREEEKAQS